MQITDTHISDASHASFSDFDTSHSLTAVIETIKTQEPDMDLMLVTGDLVHEPSDEAYQAFADHLTKITMPLFYLPGNHDDPVKMDYVLGNNGFDQSKLIHIDGWSIILLNSHVSGEHAGELSEAELGFLQQSLEANTDQNILIALHHHPVSIGSPWMDGMALLNHEPFFQIVDKHTQVKGIIWGHIHQKFETCRDDHIKLLGTPSTCLQFKPKSEVFALDKKTPAYRKIMLNRDGKLDTKVVYIDYQSNDNKD